MIKAIRFSSACGLDVTIRCASMTETQEARIAGLIEKYNGVEAWTARGCDGSAEAAETTIPESGEMPVEYIEDLFAMDATSEAWLSLLYEYGADNNE